MGRIVTTKDGKTHTLLDLNDFQDLIQEYLGYSFGEIFENIVDELKEEADYSKQRLNTDLANYEAEYDCANCAFQDIAEISSDLKEELNSNKKLNRTVFYEKIKKIEQIANNQF